MISYGGGLPGDFPSDIDIGALIGSFYGNIMVDFGMDQSTSRILSLLPWLVISQRLEKHR